MPDAPSGFRAFHAGAALRLCVFSDYTGTLETIIQAGRKNIAISSVPVRASVQRPSRLVRSIPSYVRRSLLTIVRIFILYKPARFFFFLGTLLLLPAVALGVRFLVHYLTDGGQGRIQSLILRGYPGRDRDDRLRGRSSDRRPTAANRVLLEEVRMRLLRAEVGEARGRTGSHRPVDADGSRPVRRPAVRRRLVLAAAFVAVAFWRMAHRLAAGRRRRPMPPSSRASSRSRPTGDPALLGAWRLPVAARYAAGRYEFRPTPASAGRRAWRTCCARSVRDATQRQVVDGTAYEPWFGVLPGGLTLDQLGDLLQQRSGRPAQVVRDVDLAQFRAHLRRATIRGAATLVNSIAWPLFGAATAEPPVLGYLEAGDGAGRGRHAEYRPSRRLSGSGAAPRSTPPPGWNAACCGSNSLVSRRASPQDSGRARASVRVAVRCQHLPVRSTSAPLMHRSLAFGNAPRALAHASFP